MKYITTFTAALLVSFTASISWGERFTLDWVEENEITLEKLVGISEHSNADEKFKIAQLLSYGPLLVFEGEKRSTLDANRSVILHVAAALGHARAQFTLSLDYEQGVNGFFENRKLAELWLKKAMANGYKPDAYYSNITRLKSQRAYLCDVSLETTTGADGTETKAPDGRFVILYEYGNFNMLVEDANSFKQFSCEGAFSDGPEPLGTYLYKQCVLESLDDLPEYFMSADDRSVNKNGLSAEIPYSWVVGLPDLVTIRQGKCTLLEDYNFD